MFSKLLRFFVLPILLIILVVYATIPWWLPVVAQYSHPYTGLKVERLEVGYPWHDHWHIQHVQGRQEASEQRLTLRLENIELNYNLVDLWYGILPTISINKIYFDGQLAQSSLDSVPILLLLPQRWLYNMPTSLNVVHISGKLRAPNTVLGLAGQFDANADHAHAIARITTQDHRDIFLEAKFANDNAITATLFNKQQSAPIAKLTSQMRQAGDELNWQGQVAVNIPVMQTLLADFIPDTFALPITQGRLISNWQMHVPSNQQQNLQQWLQAAYGEHQFQLQLKTNTKLAKNVHVDANITHIVDAQGPDIWQLNAGSQLALQPSWEAFNLDRNSIDSALLNGMEVRMTAQGPVELELQTAAINLGSQQALVLDGVINATLQSPAHQYQIFTQLKNLHYRNSNSWHGQADISGYYVLPQQSRLLQQVPLGIQQVQALAQLEFNISPTSWQFTLAPDSKLSANQVESQQRQSQVLLFANDRLNLSNSETLQLTYYTTSKAWQWNHAKLSLRPQTATGTSQANSGALELQIQLPAGTSQFNNRPTQGFYQLYSRDTRLRGWPEFDLLGEGTFTFGNDNIALDFLGQAQPFTSALQGKLEWDFAQQQGQLHTSATDIDLFTLQQQHQINWPLKVSSGNIDYTSQWQWQENSQQSQHQFHLQNINGNSKMLAVNGLNGQIEVQPQNELLTTSYQLEAQVVQPQSYNTAFSLEQAQLNMHSSSPIHKGLAKAMATPESWSLQSLRGHFLGGELAYQTNKWHLHNISLAQMSQVLWPDLSAEGKLSGTMLLTEDGQIQQLQVHTKQGAKLHLRQPLANDKPGAETLNQLLNNMQAEHLEVHSQAPQVGNKLPLSVRLQGQSPDFNDGQPVDLNLTVEADLQRLLAP